jgi:hypothetical protein
VLAQRKDGSSFPIQLMVVPVFEDNARTTLAAPAVRHVLTTFPLSISCVQSPASALSSRRCPVCERCSGARGCSQHGLSALTAAGRRDGAAAAALRPCALAEHERRRAGDHPDGGGRARDRLRVQWPRLPICAHALTHARTHARPCAQDLAIAKRGEEPLRARMLRFTFEVLTEINKSRCVGAFDRFASAARRLQLRCVMGPPLPLRLRSLLGFRVQQ